MIFSIGDWSRHRSYLASLLADEDSSSGCVYPAVVVEFLYVFPEELTELPPFREVVFTFDVILGPNPFEGTTVTSNFEWRIVQKNNKVVPTTFIEHYAPNTSIETCSEQTLPLHNNVRPEPPLLTNNQFATLYSEVEPSTTGCSTPIDTENDPDSHNHDQHSEIEPSTIGCLIPIVYTIATGSHNQDQVGYMQDDDVNSSTRKAKASHTSSDTTMSSSSHGSKIGNSDKKCIKDDTGKKKKKGDITQEMPILGFPDYRRSLWNDICQFAAATSQTPWIHLGDFNVIRHPAVCFGGSQRWTPAINEFNTCIHTFELSYLRYCGILFTWTNKSLGIANISEKLDKVQSNDKWLTTFPLSECEFLPQRISNHSPMVVKFGNPNPRRNIPFKFFNFLGDHRDFLTTTSVMWGANVNDHTMFQVTRKLKLLKQHLKLLNTKEFSEISSRVIEVKEALHHCEMTLDSYPSDEHLRTRENELLQAYNDATVAEESFFRQKSRINWLKEGDGNTTLFMKAFNNRCNKKKILSLHLNDGTTTNEPQVIKEEALNYFNSIFGGETSNYLGMDALKSVYHKTIPDTFIAQLSVIPSNKEIMKCFFTLKNNKSSDLMGIMLIFIRRLGLLLEMTPLRL
ncbi:uncharacterized protein LOC132272541 [Cornus florida]|uniref:uncharacterized protein LOC132272541 n=1 Tax=Cornus florida TaxID=4283 RepID=UPI0028991F05|nr:uncharacterized protein LOC132272541 [Cornus florida]